MEQKFQKDNSTFLFPIKERKPDRRKQKTSPNRRKILVPQRNPEMEAFQKLRLQIDKEKRKLSPTMKVIKQKRSRYKSMKMKRLERRKDRLRKWESLLGLDFLNDIRGRKTEGVTAGNDQMKGSGFKTFNSTGKQKSIAIHRSLEVRARELRPLKRYGSKKKGVKKMDKIKDHSQDVGLSDKKRSVLKGTEDESFFKENQNIEFSILPYLNHRLEERRNTTQTASLRKKMKKGRYLLKRNRREKQKFKDASSSPKKSRSKTLDNVFPDIKKPRTKKRSKISYFEGSERFFKRERAHRLRLSRARRNQNLDSDLKKVENLYKQKMKSKKKVVLPENNSLLYYMVDLRNYYYSDSSSMNSRIFKSHFNEMFEVLRNPERFYPANSQELKDKMVPFSEDEGLFNTKILVLDLDETLVHTQFMFEKSKNTIQMSMEDGKTYHVRNHLKIAQNSSSSVLV
jgi:hypothetical protein